MNVLARVYLTSSVGLAAAFTATPAFAGLVINPVFDSSITNDVNSAAIIGNINSAIAMYESRFTDNVSVKVYVQAGGGLGSSTWGYYWNTAGTAISALATDAKSADDAIAVSHLNTNVFGSVAYTSANGRAMGLNTPGFLSVGGAGDFDGIVSINTGVCFTNHSSAVSGKFDLYSVFCHEMNEVLGTPSGASDVLAFTPDLFRYNGFGGRSFNGDTGQHAYFSIDGTTNIVEYNQFGRTGGDWGDWVSHSPSMTQDWSIFSGQVINPGEPEFRLLDVIGYDRANPVPEPASICVVGLGALAMLKRKKKNAMR